MAQGPEENPEQEMTAEGWVSEWVSSFLMAHQHIIGYFSALQEPRVVTSQLDCEKLPTT